MSPRRSRPDSGAERERSGVGRVSRRSLLRTAALGVGSLVIPARITAQEGEDGDEAGGEEEGETGSGEEGEAGGEEGETGGEGGNETDEDGGGGGGTEEVLVGPGGDFVFDPEQLSIEPGTTVLWVWESDNHNVHPTELPDDADWEGHVEIENTDFEYEFTFDVEGEYHYVCDPHVAQGMEGDVIVGGNGGNGAAGPAELVPGTATTLIVATVTSLVAVLGLSYVFLKYGGFSGE